MKTKTKLLFLITDLFEALSDFLYSLLTPKKKGHEQAFASESVVLSSSYGGFNLTGTKQLSIKDSYTNALVVGGTGTGKSSIVLASTIMSLQNSSIVINDPSFELRKFAGHLHHAGYKIHIIDWSDATKSSRFNPLARARTASEIQRIFTMLVNNSMGKSKEPYWVIRATSLLSMLGQIIQTQEKQYQTMYNVLLLLNKLSANPKELDTLFSTYADDDLFLQYKSFINLPDNVFQSIISTAQSAMAIFSDPVVAQVTSGDNIDFEQLRREKVCVFINNKISNQDYYSAISSIFFEQMFSHILSYLPNDDSKNIFFLLDEASSLKIPGLPVFSCNCRKHRSGLMLLVQDQNIFKSQYGAESAELILANCTSKLYFSGQPISTTCVELSNTIGNVEIYDEKKQTTITKKFMEPSEIRTIRPNTGILINSFNKPILVKFRPYYKSYKYKYYSELPPPLFKTYPEVTVPVLPLIPPDHEEVA